MSLGIPSRLLTVISPNVLRAYISPFLPGNPLVARAPVTTNLYVVPPYGTQDATRYARFVGDGATTTFTISAAQIAAGYNAFPGTVNASLTDANRMQTVCMINGSPQVRKGSDIAQGTLTAGQFSTPTTTTLALPSTPAAGTVIEVISYLAADIVTVAVTGGVPLLVGTPATSLGSFYTSTLTCTLEKLP